jgi:mannonate dehydratase
MRIALVSRPLSESTLRLAKQIGVTDIVSALPKEERGPVWEFLPLLHLRKKVEDAGLTLSVIEAIPVSDRIKLGLPGRDEDLDNFCQSIRNMGAAGIPILCYNFMAVFNWLRTSTTTRGRGGAQVTSYDHRLLDDAPLTHAGVVTDEQMWDNLAHFLRRVVPVAEEAKVKLALHPDDPPISPIRGLARIMRSVEAFERVVDMVPSDYNGITFCQGCFAEMGVDVPAIIRRFGEQQKIFFVHFRNVKGSVPVFEETFHDEGDVDMVAAMRAYRDVGFDGPMRPDHVPTLEGESNDTPGYAALGRLHAVGYMKGLVDAINSGV